MPYSDFLAEITASAYEPRSNSAPSDLSPEQKAAWESPLKNSAVIYAGAGAGKTKLLVERVIKLLKSGADPKRVAVVTFTRKAAGELKKRIALKVGPKGAEGLICGTVHALALSLMRKADLQVDLASEEQEAAILNSLRDLLPGEAAELTDQELLLAIGKTREQQDVSGPLGLVALAYEESLTALGLSDFTSLLQKASALPGGLLDYMLVDESNDLSQLQLYFLRAAGDGARFWFIGDADQAIYSFRGSESSMMAKLQAKADASFVLSTNFRCAQKILAVANNVIQFGKDRPEVHWQAARPEQGTVEVIDFADGEAEAEAVEAWLAVSPQTRCVLARTQALLVRFKEKNFKAFSVHESKGLEWPEVWVIGCEAALFPHPLAPREEERRLFYVAMTRAQNALTMSYARTRSTARRDQKVSIRRASPFLFEAQAMQDKT